MFLIAIIALAIVAAVVVVLTRTSPAPTIVDPPIGSLIFTVDVEVAHQDDCKTGVMCTRISRVKVLADHEDEAVIIAAQIAACTSDAMPTRTTIDWSKF